MKQNKIFLSVVIPAFNEEQNFNKGVLESVDSYLSKQHYSWEVIVSDDGSTDKTPMLVKKYIKNKPRWHLLLNPHYGKATTVMQGIMKAKGENILFTDFDQATPIDQLERLLDKLQERYEIIIGSREIKGAKREKEPIYRHLMGKVFNFLVSILVISGIHDTQCGFKLFTKNAIKRIFPKVIVYKKRKLHDAYTGAFDVELLFLARKYHIRVAEVGVAWHHVKTNRVSPIKDSLRMFTDIVKIRLYDFFGKYEI